MDGMEEYPVIPTSITPEVGKGGVVEQDGGMFPSQGSVGMEQNEVHDVGVAPGGWNYEGMSYRGRICHHTFIFFPLPTLSPS